MDAAGLRLDDFVYETDATAEHFISYITEHGKLAGFLRLSLPHPDVPREEILEELRGCAVVRELHVYGPALELGASSYGSAQHTGLGRHLPSMR